MRRLKTTGWRETRLRSAASAAYQRADKSAAETCSPWQATPSWHRPDDADDVHRVPAQAASDQAGNAVNTDSALRMDGGLCSPGDAHIAQHHADDADTHKALPVIQKVLPSQAHMGQRQWPCQGHALI